MAVARHSEDIELQEEDTNYENDTTTTARRIQTEIAAEGHYERLDLQKIDDAVYEDLQIKTKKEKDLEKILQSGQQTVGRCLKDAAPWILCVTLALLAVVTGLAVHYNSELEERLQTRLNNLTQENKQLQREVNQLREAAGSWIGLNKTEGNWTWVDGKPLTTGYWTSGRPNNNTNNNCVKYNHNQGDWEDAICEEDFRFICEK